MISQSLIPGMNFFLIMSNFTTDIKINHLVKMDLFVMNLLVKCFLFFSHLIISEMCPEKTGGDPAGGQEPSNSTHHRRMRG